MLQRMSRLRVCVFLLLFFSSFGATKKLSRPHKQFHRHRHHHDLKPLNAVAHIPALHPTLDIVLKDEPSRTTPEMSPWSAWSACTRTCGGGVSSRLRRCLSDDRLCEDLEDHQMCNIEECDDNTTDFRANQCSLHNKEKILNKVRLGKFHHQADDVEKQY
jgi:hypothetical protein